MKRSRPGRRTNSTTLPIWASRAPICGPMAIRVLLLHADPALRDLIDEWLAQQGHTLVDERPDLVLVDLPFARAQRSDALARAAAAHPGVRVAPMPLTREALMAVLK